MSKMNLFSLSFPTKMLFPNVGLCQCWLFWWWEAVLIYLKGFGVKVACVGNSTSPLDWNPFKSLLWIVISITAQVGNLGSSLNLSTYTLFETTWLSNPKHLIS